jgi:phosphoribosyl 1,2-cyclic phosphodiesterase
MKVIFHGVRGSIPTPLSNEQLSQKVETIITGMVDNIVAKKIRTREDVRKYLMESEFQLTRTFGGNTPCVEVLAENGDRLILDAGSGIRPLGFSMLKEGFGQGKGTAHILFSHFHFDHIQGLPFFIPIFIPGNVIHYYGGASDILSIIQGQFVGPYFPVEFKMLGSKQDATTLVPGKNYVINGFQVSIHPLNHPNTSYAYRVDRDGKSLVYATDSEFMDRPPEEYESYRRFFRDADCFIVDTQYSMVDSLTTKIGWGHSSYNIDIDLAVGSGIKRLYFFHYDPMMNDEEIVRTLKEAMEYRNVMHPDSHLMLGLASEGLLVQL